MSDVSLELIVLELAQYPEALAWYVLGSAARNSLRPDSDLDLAVMPWPGKKLDPVELGYFSGKLALKVGREVDIGVLDGSNLVYAKEVFWTGTRVFCSDERAELARRAELLALYLTLQDDRREVLDAYRY